MNFDLSEDQVQVRDTVRELCAREFAPQAARWDQDAEVPHAAVERLAQQCFLGMAVPEEWGGLGYDARTITLVIEEIAAVSASLAIMIAVHNSVGLLPVYRYATDAQKQRFLPRLVSQEMSAFSLSEPDAGSDAAALRATADRQGDFYVLNGSKNWVTNGLQAGIYLIFAKTERTAGAHGISAFIVEKGSPGLVLGKPEDKMGLRGSDTIALNLEDLRVPVENRLGAEGEGFKVALSALDAGRIGVGARPRSCAPRRARRCVTRSSAGLRQSTRRDPGDPVQAVGDGAPRGSRGSHPARGVAARHGQAFAARPRWPSSTPPRPRPGSRIRPSRSTAATVT
jgi:alkylation response protein AidB-like acyl-CoA dehydrogenase